MARKAKDAARNEVEQSVTGAAQPGLGPLPVVSDPVRASSGASRSFWESLGATAEETLKFGPTGKLLDFAEAKRLERSANQPPLSADAANQLYPYMAEPFTSDVDPRVAAFQAERQLHRMELQGVIDNSPQTAMAGLGRFGTQLAAGFFDPVSLLTFEAGGAALGAARVFSGISNRFLQRAANMAVAGAPLVPLEAALSSGLQEPYGVGQAIEQGVVAPLAFSGLHEAVGIGYRTARKWIIPGKADAIAGQSAITKMASDRQVDSERVIQDVIAERQLPKPDPALARKLGVSIGELYNPDHEYNPIRSAEDFRNRRLFHAAEVANDSIRSSPGHAMDQNLGAGIYLTDNPFVAHGYAGSKYGFNGAGVFEAKIGEGRLNLIDGDRNLPAEARSAIEAAWQKMRPPELVRPLATAEGKLKDTITFQKNELEGFFKGKNGLDVIHAINDAVADGRLPAEAMMEIDRALQQAGFDGFHWKGGHDGSAKSNMVKLFDPDLTGDAGGKVGTVNKYLPDHALIPEPTPEDVQGAIDHLSSIKSDAAYVQENHEALAAKLKEVAKPIPPATEAARTEEARLDELDGEIGEFLTNGVGAKAVLVNLPDNAVDNTMLSRVFVQPKGPPGIALESSPDHGPGGDKNNVVFRDANGDPKGVLHFTYLTDGVISPEAGISVYVDPAFRRQGVATRLYDYAISNGIDVDAASGRENTRAGAEFVNARRASQRRQAAVAKYGQELMAELDAVDRARAQIEKEHTLLKAAAFCLGSGGSA